MSKIKVQFKKLYKDTQLPTQAYEGDAGVDLYAYVENKINNNTEIDLESLLQTGKTSLLLLPFSRLIVGCGFAMALPKGYEAQIRPRSGNAAKKGLTILNTPGTIDFGYRGPIKVILYNASHEAVTICHGDKIAQMVIQKIPEIEFEEVKDLPETERGQRGFGSSDN
jgi:dUTP pyrophosphatase